MIVVVLICELVKRTTLSSNRWSCSVYRLLGSGVHVCMYVCKYTYVSYNFCTSPSAPSTSVLILCNGACSIYTVHPPVLCTFYYTVIWFYFVLCFISYSV